MAMPPLSERGISQEPETTDQEGISVQELLKDDMRMIAEITGGRFSDDSSTYSFHIGNVIYPTGKFDAVFLTLREAPYREDLQVIHVRGAGIEYTFPSESKVTLDNEFVRIESPEAEGISSKILTAGKGEITFGTSVYSGK